MNYRAVGCLLLLAIVGGSSGLNFLKSSFVTTQFGALVGDTRVKGAFAFLGVPYAQPPLKSLRFARTAPWSQSWSGNRTATTVRIKPFCLGNVIFGNRSLTQNLFRSDCLQGPTFKPTGSKITFPVNSTTQQQSEDCLYLNVYVPSLQSRYVTQTGYSVLVHFPSEEFQVGTANRDIFDGTELAALANNAIVVTVNFRVGVMGFMALNELANEDPTFRSTGNYGLFDQIEALRWVRQNIRSFAGNPANITVSGESACLLMLTEASKIASSFICQSSPLLRAVSFPPTSLATQYHAKVLDGIQCARTNSLDSLECLRLQASASDIVSYVADNYLGGAYPQPQYNIGPVVDGLLFKNHPALLILSQSVDLRANSIMLGTTRDEMTWRAYAMFPGALSPSDYAAQWPRIEEALTKNYIGTLYPFILSSPEKSSAIKAVYDPIKMKHLCSNNDCRPLVAKIFNDVWYECPSRLLSAALHLSTGSLYRYRLMAPWGCNNTGSPRQALHAHDQAYLFQAQPTSCSLTEEQIDISQRFSAMISCFTMRGDPVSSKCLQPTVVTSWPSLKNTSSLLEIGAEKDGTISTKFSIVSEHDDATCNMWESLQDQAHDTAIFYPIQPIQAPGADNSTQELLTLNTASLVSIAVLSVLVLGSLGSTTALYLRVMKLRKQTGKLPYSPVGMTSTDDTLLQ